MQHRRPFLPAAILAILASAGAGADTVVLRNGFRLEADSHETVDGTVRLRIKSGGWIAVPAAEVARIEGHPEVVPAAEAEAGAAGTPAEPSLEDWIDHHADLAGLPRELVRAVVWAESGYQPGAVSPKGALGLMQLMPSTAAELGVDPLDPAENLSGGTRYLKRMLDRFDGDPDQLVKALAAYNAGPGSVDRHSGVPPYSETLSYLSKVLRRFVESGSE